MRSARPYTNWATACRERNSTVRAETSRHEHAADVFSRAVGQVGSDRLEVRIGAIHSLTGLSRDFPELRQPVSDVLAAYARTRSKDFEAEHPDNDASAIMEFLHPALKEK